jgi:hypothetical protein
MKTKLLALLLLAGSSVFAGPRVVVRAGIPVGGYGYGYGYGYVAPAPVYRYPAPVYVHPGPRYYGRGYWRR